MAAWEEPWGLRVQLLDASETAEQWSGLLSWWTICPWHWLKRPLQVLVVLQNTVSAVASLKLWRREHEIGRAQLGQQSELWSDLSDWAPSHAHCLAGSLVSRAKERASRGANAILPINIKERRVAVTAGIFKIKKKMILCLVLSVKCSESLLTSLARSPWWSIYSSGSRLCQLEMWHYDNEICMCMAGLRLTPLSPAASGTLALLPSAVGV